MSLAHMCKCRRREHTYLMADIGRTSTSQSNAKKNLTLYPHTLTPNCRRWATLSASGTRSLSTTPWPTSCGGSGASVSMERISCILFNGGFFVHVDLEFFILLSLSLSLSSFSTVSHSSSLEIHKVATPLTTSSYPLDSSQDCAGGGKVLSRPAAALQAAPHGENEDVNAKHRPAILAVTIVSFLLLGFPKFCPTLSRTSSRCQHKIHSHPPIPFLFFPSTALPVSSVGHNGCGSQVHAVPLLL